MMSPLLGDARLISADYRGTPRAQRRDEITRLGAQPASATIAIGDTTARRARTSTRLAAYMLSRIEVIVFRCWRGAACRGLPARGGWR